MSFFFPKHTITLGTIEPHFPLWPAQHYRLGKDAQEYMAMVVGQTGSGKSKLLLNIFAQHVLKQRHLTHKHTGAAIIEPHHDLSLESVMFLLGNGFYRKNPRAYDDVIYIDWANGGYVPWNLLARQTPADDDETIALNVLDAFTRVWPELESAPNFHTLLLSALTTLIANELPITYLYQLLTQKSFRDICLARTPNRLAHQVFEDWYDKLGRDQMDTAGSTLRRAFLLSYSPYTKLTFGQPTCAINLRKIMDEGRSLIINLGNIPDELTKKLIGAIILKQLEQAAFSRRDILPSERTPFVALIDEFQLFAAQENTIAAVLSQARKFKLRLYLATQSLSNISSARLQAALENCRLKVMFGLGASSAYLQARDITLADPYAIKEEPLTDTQHASFLGVGEQQILWENELKSLKPQYCYVKAGDKAPIKIKTSTIQQPKVASEELAGVLDEYKRRYQKTQAEAEEAIARIAVPAAPAASRAVPPLFQQLFNQPAEKLTD